MYRYLLLLLLSSEVAASGAFVRPIWKARERRGGGPCVIDQAGNTYLAKWSDQRDRTLTVVKRNSRGHRVWSTSLRHEASPRSLAVDSAGNVYLTGFEYHPDNQTDSADTVTWRFDRGGRLLWRVVYQGPHNASDYPVGIGLDAAGNLYVAGDSFGSSGPAWNARSFFLRYDSAGNVIWQRQFGSEYGSIQTLAINPEGGIARIGWGHAMVLTRGGDLLWSRQETNTFRPAYDNAFASIAAFDRNNQLHVGGIISTQRGVVVPVVRKFSQAGEVLWIAEYHGPFQNTREDVCLQIDAQGNAYLGLEDAIACQYQWEWGETTPELHCDYRPTIVKFSPDGEMLWTSRLAPNAPYDFYHSGMAFGPNGSIGVSIRASRFDPRTGWGISHNTFFVQCDSQGNQIWNAQFHYPGDRDLWPRRPTIDAKGNLYAPAALVDRTNGDHEIDLLFARFYPFRLPSAPRMNLQPSSRTVVEGETALLEADASGKGRIRYRWRFNGRPLSEQTQRVLQLDNVRLDQAGDYSVEARSFHGTVISPEARLTVLPANR